MLKNVGSIKNLLIRSLQILRSSTYSFAVLCSPLWLMFSLYVFWGRRSFIDHICRNPGMVLSMFYRLVSANFLFSLRDINLTLGLLPPRRHVVWRDSVGVESSRSGLKSECADIFHQSFLWLLRYTDELQRGRDLDRISYLRNRMQTCLVNLQQVI